MTTLKVAGLAGLVVLASGGVALAQQNCLFGTGCLIGAKAPEAAPAQPAPVSDVEAEKTLAANAVDGDTTPNTVAKPKKPVAKPVHTVTIAADAAEVAKLESLAAVLPKHRIKIVAAKSEAGKATDFAVATSLDDQVAGEKAKLFTEQLHIVAGAKIRTLADLQGKVVSFGRIGDPTQAAAREAFAAANVSVKETPLDLDNALDGLATGDVDAVVILAPAPDGRLAALKGQDLHLVSWPNDGPMPDGAAPTTIDPAQYPGLAKSDASVRAVGIDAVLAMSPKAAREPAARGFLAALSQHSAILSKRGFDLIRADLEQRAGRKVASAERR